MRPIKFRAWDETQNPPIMVEWKDLQEFPVKYVFLRSREVTMMQYTGLKSSDGGCDLPIQECYFGDIIRFYTTDGEERLAEIIWYEEELCIGFKRLSDGFVYTQKIFNDNGYFQPSKIQFEIIGNIYENPELIK